MKLGGAHYLRLQQLTGCFVFLFLIALLSSRRRLRGRAPIRTLVASAVLVLVSVLSMSLSTPVRRWSLEHGVLSSWLAMVLPGQVGPIEPVSTSNALGQAHTLYWGSDLQQKVQKDLQIRGAPTRGVLLITIDALRADLLSETLGGQPLTPNVSQWAQEGTSFLQATSPAAISHWTLFSMFSGLLPGQILATSQGLDKVPLITDRLNDEGVVTRSCFTARVHGARSRRLDFTRENFGFQHATLHEIDPDIDEMIKQVLPSRTDKRWFSYVHLMTPHAPYDQAPSELKTGNTDFDAYCGEVRLADRQVKTVIEAFASRGLLKDAWVIVSSDHGEAFGEHQTRFHGSNLYQEAIHVPLIIRPPFAVSKPEVTTQVSLVDLAPSLEDLFSLRQLSRPPYAGRSWLPLILFSDDEGRANRSIAEAPPISQGRDRNLIALVTDRYKFIVDREYRTRWLFDRANDPKEETNIADHSPDLVRRLEAQLMAAGAPIEMPDTYGRILSLLATCETSDSEATLALLPKLARETPPAAAALVSWFMTRDTLFPKQKLSDALLPGNRPLIRQALRLIRFKSTWVESEFKTWIKSIDDPWVLMGAQVLAVEHKLAWRIPQLSENSTKEPLALLLVGQGLKSTGQASDFPRVQHLLTRAFATKNPFIRRLGYQLIAATNHLGSAPHLLRLEQQSLSVFERRAMLKAVSVFNDPEVKDRFLTRYREDPNQEIRDLVLRIWLRGRQLPDSGVTRYAQSLPLPLPQTLTIEPSEKPRVLILELENQQEQPFSHVVLTMGAAACQVTWPISDARTILIRSPLPKGAKDVTMRLRGRKSTTTRLRGYLIIEGI